VGSTGKLTHIGRGGEARMVDVSAKPATERVAIAEGRVTMNEKTLALVRSDRSDLKKFEKLKLHQLDTGDQPDIFDGFFKDHSIDIRTGELLGRYIAEERDSARLFRSCYEQLVAAGNGSANATSESLQSLDAKVDALCRAVDELRQIVVAQAMPAPTRKSRAAS